LTAASASAAEGGTVPTYQYACTDCAERLEAVQKFTDEPLSVCPSCGGKLRKVFSPVGIVFKGSGFYRTDSRNGQKETAAANGSDSKKADSTSKSDSSSGDSSSKSDKKPGEKAGSGTSSSSPSSGSSSSSGSKVA
jgi:putative FmdB family regulatory protein